MYQGTIHAAYAVANIVSLHGGQKIFFHEKIEREDEQPVNYSKQKTAVKSRTKRGNEEESYGDYAIPQHIQHKLNRKKY